MMMIQKMQPKHTKEAITTLLSHTFPQAFGENSPFTILEVFPAGATLRLDPNESHLRHGGTVSGPTMFALADIAGYIAILGHVDDAVHTVTANMTISFLNKPEYAPLYAKAEILKLGRQLVTVNIAIHSVETERILAHATASYALPQAKTGAK
jgi:uncharacterized protein (TIGR00369 family)